jgi:hypothetical protein
MRQESLLWGAEQRIQSFGEIPEGETSLAITEGETPLAIPEGETSLDT